MALPAIAFEFVCKIASAQNGGRAIAAGYPDLLVTGEQLVALLGAARAARVPVRADSARIAARHSMADILDCVFDTEAVFSEIGLSLEVIDIKTARGKEAIVDLNYPVDDRFKGRYDLVLDTGTCEHCFNIAQAAVNLASMARVGGHLIQILPLNVFNHGFYNVSPTWFFDFYPANGFGIEYLAGVANLSRSPRCFELPRFERFRDLPADSYALLVARREKLTEFTFPMQHKYLVLPDL